MQWFLSLSESSDAFSLYCDLIKVAVHTAQKRTSLRPHILYDGQENLFTRWLRTRGVAIIFAKSFLAEEIGKMDTAHFDARLLGALRGVFLRLELPMLGAQLGFDDRVLYTDCDVFFRNEVVDELSGIDCKYFAVAGEFDPTDYYQMNTGVMLMNLPAMRTLDADFRAYTRGHLQGLYKEAWDQGAYRRFFGWQREALLWNTLRPELNWKPYWGKNAEAKVIHFHGAKPFHRGREAQNPAFDRLFGGGYYEFCEEWDRFHAEIEA